MRNKDYKKYKHCRFCYSKKIKKVIDLGKMPLAGGFLTNKSSFSKEKKYPLSLSFCKDCFLLQTSLSINPDILFKNYFYHSSTIKTLVDHFEKIATDLKKTHKKGDFIVEIGCNDGAFIKALLKNKFNALGIDPATNITKPLIKQKLPIINNYFSEKLSKKIVIKYGQADTIYSFHTLAHIPDMHDIFKGVKNLLKPEGYLVFEIHYLGDLLKGLQYDMIYHEHLHYYSLLAIENFVEKYDMEVFDIQRSKVRAGSITFFVQNRRLGKRKVKKSVLKLKRRELLDKFNNPLPYRDFERKMKKTKKDLLKLVQKLQIQNKLVAGYGASGRGTIISNYLNLTSKVMPFVVDDAPFKQEKFMPGTHNLIRNPIELINREIDYVILFAWPFLKEVKLRNRKFIKKGGKFIIPLPKVTIK